MRWCTWVNFHYRAKEKRRCGGYTSSVGCAATFPSRGRLTRKPNSPLNPNLNSSQISNPAYLSTSSEKMEFAQANHSRLKVYSSSASMLSCMK